jgi:hypothetical protein
MPSHKARRIAVKWESIGVVSLKETVVTAAGLRRTPLRRAHTDGLIDRRPVLR